MQAESLLDRIDDDAAACSLVFGAGSDVHRAAQLLYRLALGAVIDMERHLPSDTQEFAAVYALQQRSAARAMRVSR